MSSLSSIDQKPEFHHQEVTMPRTESTEETQVSEPKSKTEHVNPGFRKLVPAPLGFAGFACCSFVLGLFNTGLITDFPPVAIGVALGYGTTGQFLCGLFEMLLGNNFPGTCMLTFSGFFFTYGIMMIPASGFTEAALAHGGERTISQCMGLVQAGFAVCAFLFFWGTLRQPYMIRVIMFQIFWSFCTGAIGAFTEIPEFTKASGWMTFLTGCSAFYISAAHLYTPENTFVRLPFF
jgi:succinate-acetate transporter protein